MKGYTVFKYYLMCMTIGAMMLTSVGFFVTLGYSFNDAVVLSFMIVGFITATIGFISTLIAP